MQNRSYRCGIQIHTKHSQIKFIVSHYEKQLFINIIHLNARIQNESMQIDSR